MAIKLALWDVYGTILFPLNELIDPGHYEKFEAGVQYLHTLGINCKKEEIITVFFEEVERYHKDVVSKNGAIKYPEVRIDEVWINIFKRISGKVPYNIREIAFEFEKKVNRTKWDDNIENALNFLYENGVKQGFSSNAQFYTPIILREYLGDKFDFLFYEQFSFFSYKFLFSKPDMLFYNEIIKVIDYYGLRRDEVLFIGNDFEKDVLLPSSFGFRAIFLGKGKQDSEKYKCAESSEKLLFLLKNEFVSK